MEVVDLSELDESDDEGDEMVEDEVGVGKVYLTAGGGSKESGAGTPRRAGVASSMAAASSSERAVEGANEEINNAGASAETQPRGQINEDEFDESDIESDGGRRNSPQLGSQDQGAMANESASGKPAPIKSPKGPAAAMPTSHHNRLMSGHASAAGSSTSGAEYLTPSTTGGPTPLLPGTGFGGGFSGSFPRGFSGGGFGATGPGFGGTATRGTFGGGFGGKRGNGNQGGGGGGSGLSGGFGSGSSGEGGWQTEGMSPFARAGDALPVTDDTVGSEEHAGAASGKAEAVRHDHPEERRTSISRQTEAGAEGTDIE